MRIGIDFTGADARQRYTGMGEYAAQLVSHLAAIDKENEYYLFSYVDSGPFELGPNFNRALLPTRSLGKLTALHSHQIALPRLASALRLDVLHIPWVYVRPSYPATPWRTRCPLVVTLHDVIPLAYYRRHAPGDLPWRLSVFYRLNLRLAARAAQIVTVSEHSRQDIIRHTEIPAERVTVIYNGVAFSPLHLPAEEARERRRGLGLPESYLLYAGSFEPRKNLRGTLAAYAQVAETVDLPLVMIVERESGHAPTLLEYARSLNLGKSLVFLNSLSREDLRLVYTDAELFLFPSFYEGFGFPPLQAMSCSIPVISSRDSSLPEVLGDAAYYVDPHHPEQIARAIMDILRDSDARNQLAAAGPDRAARYTWTRAAMETLAIYQRAATRF